MGVHIYGLEVEHGVQILGRIPDLGLRSRLLETPAAELRILIPKDPRIAEIMRTSFQRKKLAFFANGGRLEDEIGQNVEYAGPECTTPTDVVRADEAGKLILNELLDSMNQVVKPAQIRLIRSNTGKYQTNFTCGSDECYRFPGERYIADLLTPHLVSRQILTSAGEVIEDPTTDAGWRFELSARARFMHEVAGSHFSGPQRAMVKESASYDQDDWQRLQITCGDTTMSQWSTLLRLGSTAIVVEMLLHPAYQKFFRTLIPADPIVALHSVSRDIDLGSRTVGLRKVITLRERQHPTSALDMQRRIFAKAETFVAREGGGPSDAPRIIELWRDALATLESRGWDGLTDSADFAIKLSVLNRELTRNPHAKPAQLRACDMLYHTVGPSGLHERMVKAGLIIPVVKDVEELVGSPPPGTRAQARSALINRAGEAVPPFRLVGLTWTSAAVERQPGSEVSISLSSPEATTTPTLDQVLSWKPLPAPREVEF